MGKRKAKVEVLAPIERPSIPAAVGAALERLVEQKVAQVVADKGNWFLEPWFRPKQESYAIRRLQTVSEQRKWRVYFDKYGCLCCKKKKAIHSSNGFCTKCRPGITHRLAALIREMDAERQGRKR